MSKEHSDAAQPGYLISGSEDTTASSISLSLSDSSVRPKEKFKTISEKLETSPQSHDKTEEKQWWLKRPEIRLGFSTVTKNSVLVARTKDTQTPDATSSLKEFLEKEEFCKAQQKHSGDNKPEKDDTTCDILASTAFDKYPSDFENATDEDIGSFLEEMSKIAGALSPSSGQERTKSREDSRKNPTGEEKSVEELLEEAEKLVRKNYVGLSKSSSRSDALIIEKSDNQDANDVSVARLEKDIFQLIEQEVHKESEKIRKSPKNEKKVRESSPAYNEITYENANSLKPPTLMNLEAQKKRFDEDKVEISSSSDLDDPIDRHSKSEDPKTVEESSKDKENLQKEITDVDKDFFDDLLRRSKEKIEGGMSGSSSFGQEDFSHFLRILQGQDRKEQETDSKKTLGVSSKNFKDDKVNLMNDVNIIYPEKEITEILEKELPSERNYERVNDTDMNKVCHEFGESDSSVTSVEINFKSRKKKSLSRNSSQDRFQTSENMLSCKKKIHEDSSRENISSNYKKIELKQPCDKSKLDEGKKAISSNSELYTVGLTPRLELFADSIPKLIAERTNENLRKDEIQDKNDENDMIKMKNKNQNFDEEKDKKSNEKFDKKESETKVQVNEKNTMYSKGIISEDSNVKVIAKFSSERSNKFPDKKYNVENTRLRSSKSYDQLSKPSINLRSSLNDVGTSKLTESSRRTYQQSGKLSLGVLKYTKHQTKHMTSKQVSKIKTSPKSSTTKFDPLQKSVNTTKPESSGKYFQAGGDSRKNLTKDDFEALCREEKHKNALLKEQIESEAKLYKQQIQCMRTSFEEELFALKKQNIILKAKIDELTLNEKLDGTSAKVIPKIDARNELLERELEKQEGIINAYETENKRLVIEMERLQEEMKNTKQNQRNKVEINETQRLNDTIKDLREEALKLNFEVTDLRLKNNDAALRMDDVIQQNSLLKEELEMFKEQLRTKNDFINARLQTMTVAELESRKKTDDLKVDLSSKTEQLKNIKIEYEKLEQAIMSLEKEVLELRMNEGNLMEKLQISKSHVEREKQLTQKLKDQVILDNKKILDLNRQVREVERILKRKNPDSVSALILTAKSDNERINFEKVKLLEDRVASLEGEIKAKEEIGQEKLTDLQNKFAEMRDKYVKQVMELEGKLLDATTRDRTIYNDAFTQTIVKSVENKCVEAGYSLRDDRERSSSIQMENDTRKDIKNVKIAPKSQNPKEDTHLLATIRGLKLEITNKDKKFSKISKDFQELQKTNRRLQKERERLLNDRRNFKGSLDVERNGRPVSVCSDQRLQSARTMETNDLNSNHYKNGHLSNGSSQRLSESVRSVPKLYDPLQYSENDDRTNVKKLTNENGILKEELNKINKDFMTLKNKRLHDLNLLQEEHEREMASLVKEYSIKFGDSKVVKLQGQINTQVAIITHLKQQIEKLRDYKEQVLVLKVEREHLENKVKILNEKVKYLSTPGTEQLQLLQDKITILQQRHESREMTLQSLVRDLMRNKTQCRDCKGEKGKNNKQLCYFRQELDNILGMLQEISNV